jgi:hypothetical protein
MDSKVILNRTVEHHHEVAVENLAKSLNHSTESVNTLYAMVLRHYTKKARIKHFLSALVTKRVTELLKDTAMPSDIEGRRSRSREF